MPRKYSCLFASVLTLVVIFPAFAADDWPTADQIKLVSERKANLPGKRFVADVDWYEPLEVVKGSDTDLASEPEQSPEIEAADELAAGHDSYALIFWQDGAIRHERYWGEFNAQSRFTTASMHKTVVAVLLGIASDEGLIGSVEEPLSRYLPELEGSERARAPLRSLLEMASGLKSPPYSDDPASPYWQAYLGNNLEQAIAHWPDAAEPPYQEFYYTSINPQYLAWVIERTSGQRYAEFLSDRLWQPIGAADGRLWLDHEGGSPRAWCCLHASARDWLKFGLLILNKGRVGERQVVSADWIERMTAASSQNPNYGWLIWRGSPHNPARTYTPDIPIAIPAKEPFAQDDVVYLDGSGGQRVYIVPSQNAVIVRIGMPASEWDDSELPNLLLGGAETGGS